MHRESMKQLIIGLYFLKNKKRMHAMEESRKEGKPEGERKEEGKGNKKRNKQIK